MYVFNKDFEMKCYGKISSVQRVCSFKKKILQPTVYKYQPSLLKQQMKVV